MSGRLSVALRVRVTGRPLQRGAVAVEFALVIPILIMLLLGTVTSGVAYSRSVGLTNAVREGARFGAVVPSGAGWKTSVEGRTRGTQFDGSGTITQVCAGLLKNNTATTAVPTTPVHAWECFGPTVISSPPPPTAPAVPAGGCVAVVWAAQPFTIEAGLVSWTRRMQRGSVTRYERTC